MTSADLRWLSPLPLWAGILAGPVAWACDLTLSYALAKPACLAQPVDLLHLIAGGALAVVTAGAMVSWLALRRTEAGVAADGGTSRARARFMAILGLTSNALFALTIVAGAIPPWLIDACQ